MKYLAFVSTILSLLALALLMIMGIRLDVLIAELIGLFMGTMAVMLLVFIFSLILLMRIRNNAGKEGAKSPDETA